MLKVPHAGTQSVLRLFSSTLSQVLNVILPVLVVLLLVIAANFKHGVFGPVLIQVLLLVGVVYAVVTRRIGQLFDLFAPNSAAEAGVYRKQFSHGNTHYTWNWCLNLAITFASWLFGLMSNLWLSLTLDTTGEFGGDIKLVVETEHIPSSEEVLHVPATPSCRAYS